MSITMRSEVAISDEEIHVIVEREDERGLGPEGYVGDPKLLGQGGRPHEEGVGDEAGEGSVGAQRQLPYELLDVGGEDVENCEHELVVVERAVEGNGEAIAHELVAYIEAGGAGVGEDVVAEVGAGAAGGATGLVVDGFSIDEGDGEAPGGEFDGEVDGRDDVALERVGDEEGVRRLPVRGSHCFCDGIALVFLLRKRDGVRTASFSHRTYLCYYNAFGTSKFRVWVANVSKSWAQRWT